MNKNILYFVDDYILFYSKNNRQKYKYKINSKALKHGKIANTKLFISNYRKFLKINNLNNNLFGDKIYIIVNPSYTKVDIEVLTNIFNSLNYRKVIIVSELKVTKLNNSNAYLNYNSNYAILSYIDYYKEKHAILIDKELMFKNNLVKILKEKVPKKNIFCFGLNPEIADFIDSISSSPRLNAFHFSNDDTYLIDEFIS